jgi:hypothetical protein
VQLPGNPGKFNMRRDCRSSVILASQGTPDPDATLKPLHSFAESPSSLQMSVGRLVVLREAVGDINCRLRVYDFTPEA